MVGRPGRGHWPWPAAAARAGRTRRPADAQQSQRKLVVWDWKSGDATAAAYIEKAKADFAKKHPDVTVEFVAQPFDQYYTLLGAAIQAGKGPDVMLFNGGGQIRDRVDALLPLDQYVAEDKQPAGGLGRLHQGRQDLRRAGDPAGPPDLLQQDALREGRPRPGEPAHDLGRVRRRLRRHQEGDRRQVLRAGQQGGHRHPVLPVGPRLRHPDARRSTTTGSPASATGPRPNVKRIFELWKEANDNGLNSDGRQLDRDVQRHLRESSSPARPPTSSG